MVWEVNDDSRGNLFLQQYYLCEYMTDDRSYTHDLSSCE